MIRKKFRGNEVLTAAMLIVIGCLFMIYKGGVISIAMSLIGVTLLALGIIDLLKGHSFGGVIKLVFSLLVLLCGWLFIKLALYILGAILLVLGVMDLSRLSGVKMKKISLPLLMHLIQPIIYILIAICLFFNQGGAISWVFTVSGLFLIIDGIVGLVGALDG